MRGISWRPGQGNTKLCIHSAIVRIAAYGWLCVCNMKKYRLLLLCLITAFTARKTLSAAELRVLFLGDNGRHRPADRFKQLQPVMAAKKIELTYTESLADLN